MKIRKRKPRPSKDYGLTTGVMRCMGLRVNVYALLHRYKWSFSETIGGQVMAGESMSLEEVRGCKE